MNDVERCVSSALLDQTGAHSPGPEMASDSLFETSLLGCAGLMESSFAHSSAQLSEPSTVTIREAPGEAQCGP